MERISANSLFKHGPCKCSPNFCFHTVYVCVLYRSMGTGLLRMNIHTLCTLSCTAHTVDTSLFTSKCLVLVSKNSSACAQLLYPNKYQRIIQKKQAINAENVKILAKTCTHEWLLFCNGGNSVMTTILPGSLKLAYLASGQIVDDWADRSGIFSFSS